MAKRFLIDTNGTLTTSLVSYWKLWDVNDSYGSNHLTNTNGVTFTSGGKVSSCANFDGTHSQYLISSTVGTTRVNNFSFGGWVYLASASLKGCFFHNGSASSATGWSIGVGSNTQDSNGNEAIGIADGIAWIDWNQTIGTGWHFFVMVRDANVWKIYIDSVLCATTVSGDTPNTPTSNTIFGANRPGVFSRYFTGKLCECFLYEKVLNQIEINDLFNGGSGQTLVTVAPSTAVSAQRTVGIKKVYAKVTGEQWQTLGQIRNGELTVIPQTSENSIKNNIVYDSYIFDAKFELIQTSLAELQKIDSLIGGATDFLFELTDAETIPVSSTATEGWATVTSSQIGVSAKYLSDSDPSKNQFVELNVKGALLSSEIDSALKATITTTDFHIAQSADETYSNNNGSIGGSLFGYYIDGTAGNDLGVPANLKANGFTTVEIKESTDVTYSSLGNIKDGKLSFDWIFQEDSYSRPIVFNIDSLVEYDALVSDADTLVIIDNLNQLDIDVRITLFDGKVFTLASKLGIDIGFKNKGDFDGFRKLHFIHKGTILPSDFDAIIS